MVVKIACAKGAQAAVHPVQRRERRGIVAGDSFGKCDGHHIMIDFLRDFLRQNAEVAAASGTLMEE